MGKTKFILVYCMISKESKKISYCAIFIRYNRKFFHLCLNEIYPDFISIFSENQKLTIIVINKVFDCSIVIRNKINDKNKKIKLTFIQQRANLEKKEKKKIDIK